MLSLTMATGPDTTEKVAVEYSDGPVALSVPMTVPTGEFSRTDELDSDSCDAGA